MNQQELEDYLLREGAFEVGFSYHETPPFAGLHYAVSVVIKLSGPVVEQIQGAPTQTYFHHYRTVNAFIDRLTLKAVIQLEKAGYRAASVPASQSVGELKQGYAGIFPHKTAAVAAGLGSIGKSALFLSKRYGARVRLGTIFTDMPIETAPAPPLDLCSGCDACVKACPAGAITGNKWVPGCKREDLINPAACSEHMKRAYQHIGRGAVCGICMRVCPYGREG